MTTFSEKQEYETGFDWGGSMGIAILCRLPWINQGGVRAVCRSFRDVLSSEEFVQERYESGYVEIGMVLVVDGSWGHDRPSETILDVGGTFLKGQTMTPHRKSYCSTVIDNELWVFGGTDWFGRESLSTVEVFSHVSNNWRSLPAMNTARSVAVCGVLAGGSPIVAGGYNNNDKDLTSAEAYDFTTGVWNPIAPLPCTVNCAAAVVLNGCLFVAGGGGRGTSSEKLLMWDTKTWTFKASMPIGRKGATSVVYEGKMMVIGGWIDYEMTDSVIIYDPETDTWSDGPSLPEPRANNCHAVEHEGYIILICHKGSPNLCLIDGNWTPELEFGVFFDAVGSVVLG